MKNLATPINHRVLVKIQWEIRPQFFTDGVDCNVYHQMVDQINQPIWGKKDLEVGMKILDQIKDLVRTKKI